MRTPRNDPDGLTDSQDSGAAERRCILTGAHGGRDALLRLALSPDGVIVPDVLARAPGRGAWIGVSRGDLEIAVAKGKLKGALARAFKGAPAAIPADLADQIDTAFRRTLLAQLGMAAKAGVLLTGAEKIDVASRSGQVALLAHAADAAEGGRRKRDQSWRVGEDREGSGLAGTILPVDRAALSVALGRDNAVHIALIDEGWAERVSALLDRWHRYAGWARGGAAPSAEENIGSIPEIGDGQTVAV
jgi:predicted RNA-binding protein YlxR (DUF448 family)